MKKRNLIFLGSALLSLSLGSSVVHAHDRPSEAASPRSSQLAAWESIYWKWSLGQLSVPQDHHGNAVVNNVVLLNIPNTPGDGTPGSIQIRLDRWQWFMLPLWALLGTSYSDGTPTDPFEPISIFQTLVISFTIDGTTVIDASNKMAYYSQFKFCPEIPYDSSPVAGVAWFEGNGILHAPLRPGTHILKLDVKNSQPAFGSQISEFHSTWVVSE